MRRLEPRVSVDASGTPVRPWSCGRAPGHRPRNANWPLRWVAGRCRLEKGTQRVLDSRLCPRFCSPTSKVTDDHLFIGNNLGDARIVSGGGDRLFEGTENRLPGWR